MAANFGLNTSGYILVLSLLYEACLERFAGTLSKIQWLLFVEVCNRFQQRIFNVNQYRVMPPVVPTLIQGILAVYKKVVEGALRRITQVAFSGRNVSPETYQEYELN